MTYDELYEQYLDVEIAFIDILDSRFRSKGDTDDL